MVWLRSSTRTTWLEAGEGSSRVRDGAKSWPVAREEVGHEFLWAL